VINLEDLELKIAIFKIKNFARFLVENELLRLSTLDVDKQVKLRKKTTVELENKKT
jgi:hypothetical protein